MIYNLVTLTVLSVSTFVGPSSEETTPIRKDTLTESVVTSSVKMALTETEQAIPVTTFTMKDFGAARIGSPKNLAGIVPGLIIPDYGSSMTSTIYMRGIGSRMENPVIGLYIDDIPVIDKNNYDFSFLDIRRADIFRGPQGTLYGRNSMLGVLSVETLSPAVWQGVRGAVEYGSANSLRANASIYRRDVGTAVMYSHSDGFYVNDFSGRNCDVSDNVALRFRYVKSRGNIDIDNILSASYTDEGGYPYRLWTAGDGASSQGYLNPVNYNDRSAYKRISVMDGFRVNASLRAVNLSSVTSLQLLHDSMDLDQDFTPKSMFTLNQTQNQVAVTQEFVVRPKVRRQWWDSQSGVFAFARYNGMDAPVTFLQDGIRQLILDNANSHIPSEFGKLEILEDKFVISSNFAIWNYNVAAYHESYFRLGRWLLTAGLRLDHEGDFMGYDSGADIHFKMSKMSGFIPYSAEYKGDESNFYFEVLPKASALFDASKRRMAERGLSLKFTASVSRGYRSGGFNTQIFSDILQNTMMNGIMSKLGIYLDSGNEVNAASTVYKPETCIDYELGGRLALTRNGHSLAASVTAYNINCRNQQITVFPYGKGTGRMMANAGESRSRGVESEVAWRWKGLSVNASASFMDARFVSYDDGRNDYSGNRIPYSPSSSLYARAGYSFSLRSDVLRSISVSADVLRSGELTWNESGDLKQSPYILLGGDLRFSFKWFDLFVAGENLSDTDYCTFYFKSVGNSFFQTGKPRRFRGGVSVEF